jgi:hypothetical protein
MTHISWLLATRQAGLETDKRAGHNDARRIWASPPLEIMSIDRLLYRFESQEFSTSFHSGEAGGNRSSVIASKSSLAA